MMNLENQSFIHGCLPCGSILRNRWSPLHLSLGRIMILLVMLFSFLLPGPTVAGQIWFNPNYLLLIPMNKDDWNDQDFHNYGTIYSQDKLTNRGQITNHSGGLITNYQGTLNNPGSLWNSSGGSVYNESKGTLNNSGQLTNDWVLWNKTGSTVNNSGNLYNNSMATLSNHGALNSTGKLYNFFGGTLLNFGTLTNAGSIGTPGTLINQSGGTLNNYGTLDNNGTLTNDGVLLNRSGGTLLNFNEGTLTNSVTGTVTNDGTLDNGSTLTNSGTLTNAGTLTNRGTLENQSGGTLDNQSGGTLNNKNNGTLNNNGNLNNNGTLSISSGSFFNQNTAAAYSGTGSIVLGGTLNNTSSNAFNISTLSLTGGVFNSNGAGPVNIASATVAGGNTGTIQGVTPIGLTTASVDGTLGISAVITGAGALTKTGAGTLILSGTNTYTGGTKVSAGILEGTATSLQGAITNNAQVVFNQGTSGTYAGIMNGAGALTKTGAGTLTLSGDNIYTGATAIDAGVLSVKGSITSSVAIGAAGTLAGTGSITGDVTNKGAISPGKSVGTITIYGNYTHHAGSVYAVDLNPVESDKLLATGIATLNGGSVSVLAGSGTYAMNVNYDYSILRAGSVTGTFAKATSNLAFLTPSLSYDATNVYLRLARNSTNFADVALTANQASGGAALDRASASATGDMSVLMSKLLLFSAQEARATYDRITGLSHLAFTGATLSSINRYLETVTGRMGDFITGGPSFADMGLSLLASRTDVGSDAGNILLAALENVRLKSKEEKPNGGFWMRGYGDTGERKGNDISSKYDYWSGGLTVGFDRPVGDSMLLGVSTGYSSTKATMKDLSDSGTVASYQGSLYGAWLSDPWYVNALIAYGYNRYDTTRSIVFGPIARPAYAHYSGQALSGYAETGYLIRIDTVSIIPIASLQASNLSQDGFTETDAGALNLNVDRGNTTSLIGSLGARLRKDYRTASGTFTPELRVRWLHEFLNDDYSLNASFAGDPGSPFTVRGDRPTRDSAAPGFRLAWETKKNISLLLSCDANISNDHTEYSGSLGMRYTW